MPAFFRTSQKTSLPLLPLAQPGILQLQLDEQSTTHLSTDPAMTKHKSCLQTLLSYIDSFRPIIYFNHFDFFAIDNLISQIANNDKIFEYNNALGSLDFKWKNPKDYAYTQDLLEFLLPFYDNSHENYLVLKDIHSQLDNPKIVAMIKAIALKRASPLYENYETTVFIVSNQLIIPPDLEHLITIYTLPNLTKQDYISMIYGFIEDCRITPPDKDVIQELAFACKGLSEFEVNQVLSLAYQNDGQICLHDKQVIIKEKEQFIRKSGILEIVNIKESIDDIGGLSYLKEWLKKKAMIFNDIDKAVSFGVDIPKGILLVGMPGCGKSLVAKASASLFDVPLLRLDVGKLLGKYIGESEENFGKAIKVAEAISPCILWIDEIEKAFSGVGETGGASDVTTRLFGNFLTWLQEKENAVFVVATANHISKFPPEFLRKGRFDELFYVTFPTRNERKNIFRIHLQKRRRLDPGISLDELALQTDGFSGADIESVVKESIENAFLTEKRFLKTENLLSVVKETTPLSKSFEKEINAVQEHYRQCNFKPASSKE